MPKMCQCRDELLLMLTFEPVRQPKGFTVLQDAAGVSRNKWYAAGMNNAADTEWDEPRRMATV